MAESRTDWNKVGAVSGILLGVTNAVFTFAGLGLMVWQIRLQSQSTGGVSSEVDFSAWWPTIVLGICLLLGGTLQVGAAVLFLWAKRSKPTLPNVCADSWLHDLAKEQACEINAYVSVDCWVLNPKLIGDDPYIDFNFRIASSCVYRLTLTELSGSVCFGKDRLREPPILRENSVKDLSIGRIGYFVISQPLTQPEAVAVLNQGEQPFALNELHATLIGEPGSISGELLWHTTPPVIQREVMVTRYPKLDIQVQVATYRWLYNLRHIDKPEAACFITIRLKLHNLRTSPVTIERVKLITLLNGIRYTVFAKDDQFLWTKRLLNKNTGKEERTGEKIENLNFNGPFTLPEDGWIEGRALQFDVSEKTLIVPFVNNLSGLSGSSFELFLIDKNGEQHRQEGVLSYDPIQEGAT